MNRMDRYLLTQYFRVYLMVFLSLLGIFVVADFVGNLTEFVDSANSSDSLAAILGRYYGARIPWFFDLAGRNVALLSAALTLAWMQRDSELTALMAAGVSRWRVAKPLIIASLLVAILAVINREVWVPMFRTELCRNAQDLIRKKPEKIQPKYDPQTDILLDGQAIRLQELEIDAPRFQLPKNWEPVGKKLIADVARFVPADETHPDGFLLENVRTNGDLSLAAPLMVRGQVAAVTAATLPGLLPNQVFVASNVSIDQLRRGRLWHQCTATMPLIQGLRTGRIDHAPGVSVMVHSRFVQPFLDMTLIFLGLPFVFDNGRSKAVIMQSAKSVLAIIGFGIVVVVCNGMGIQGMMPPALAAWVPLIVLVPLAILASEPLRR